MKVSEIRNLCNELAAQIGRAGEEAGVPYSACQSFYGVDWEGDAAPFLGDHEPHWKCSGDLADEAEVAAVQFFDCDGERSESATDVSELLSVAKEWLDMHLNYCGE